MRYPGETKLIPSWPWIRLLPLATSSNFSGTVSVLGDQVVEQFPLDVMELVDEDAVDVKPGVGTGEVTLETIVGRDVFGVDVFRLAGRWGGLSGCGFEMYVAE